jgi:SAM-dependent methyltransferase
MNAVLLLFILELDLHVPVSLDLTGGNFGRLTILYLASALPFFFTGLFFSVLFARQTGVITRLYAADLTGGALACLGIVPLLNFIGGPNTVLAAAVASAGAAALWAPTRASRRFAVGLIAALVLLIGANHSGRLIDIVFAKGMRRQGPWVLFSRWNALSRVEVDDVGGAKNIVIDADASTYIMNTDPHDWRPDYRKNLMSAAPSVANVLRPRGEFAIIGPGGGVDVLRALANGSPSVTGIEINPIIVNDIMRGRWAEWSFHLYDRPEVHIHIGDGRSWVRHARDKFDVLQMTLVDTWASTAAGAFALSENNLYTLEAFREYFDHLKPDGLIAITRWEFEKPHEALRVESVAMEALRRGGVRAAELPRHFMVVSDGALDVSGRAVAVLAKKSPFTPAEEEAVANHIRNNPNLVLLYSPGTSQTPLPAGAAPFHDLLQAGDPYAFANQYEFDVSPVSDNSPFFFYTLKPRMLLSGAPGRGMGWKMNIGVVVLGIVLVIAAASVLAFLILPLLLARSEARPHDGGKLLYFIAIGLGYILAEIAFIQRFVLFLGHPTYALTVVIFLMLLASGAGSMLSRHWFRDPLQVRTALVVVVALLLTYIWVLPPLLRALVGLPFLLKLMISALALVPLGLAMGMPFPSGLRALAASSLAASSLAASSLAAGSAQQDNAIEWAWALNAASSVLGSVLAMVIAIQFGLSWTLASGALAYVLALALVPRLRTLSLAP